MRIEHEQINLPTLTVTEVIHSFWELSAHWLTYRHDFWGLEKDDETGIEDSEEKRYQCEVTFMRTKISGFFLKRLSESNCWKLEIESSVMSEYAFLFKEQSKAVKIRGIIKDWIVNEGMLFDGQ